MRELMRVQSDREALRAWFDASLGRSLQALEIHRLRAIVPSLFGTVAVQLGRIGRLDMLDVSPAPARILYDYRLSAGEALVEGRPEALPFEARSVDVALLPHTLDFCDNPHQVLREVNRVLAPEGHAVILGFNPVSLWGLRRAFVRRPRAAPWNGRFLRLARIKDWLGLLDFEITHGGMLYYRPPLAREGLMDRLHFLDKMGDRWWPMTAAVYLLVAKKRVAGVTPLRIDWKAKPALGQAVPDAARRTGGVVVRMERRRKRILG